MAYQRRNRCAAFKVTVALAAIKGDQTVAESASRFGVYPAQIHTWKRALLEGAASVFTDDPRRQEKGKDALVDQLYRHIFQLKVGRDFLSARWER